MKKQNYKIKLKLLQTKKQNQKNKLKLFQNRIKIWMKITMELMNGLNFTIKKDHHSKIKQTKKKKN